VNNLFPRPDQEAVPHDEGSKVHRVTSSPRSVILVGAGRRGLGAHLPALDGCGYLRLTGIVDTTDRIAQLREIPALIVPMYDSLDRLLAEPKPDLAIVATPHDSHVPLAEKLLRAGVPTLLEKPPARSAPELGTLLKLSHDLRTPLATSLSLHSRVRYQAFIQLLRSPGLTDAEVSIRASVPSWQGVDSWRLSRERAGGGVLIDLGYHYLELLVTCLGAPADMSVLLTHADDTRSDVEGEALVSLWFADRRLQVQLWLRAWPDSARGSELSIKRAGALIHHTSEAGPAGATATGGGGQQMPTPAETQLNALVASGFLDGRGDWYQALRRQHLVMELLDELYASADHIACPPGKACQPDMASLANPTVQPERTPA
jgi:predicted dehydrogenase